MVCQSHFIEVDGDAMHYLTCGDQGSPIVFLHGIPASSHTWRRVMPLFSDQARCIAPDMIGVGRSAKPDIPYRLFDQLFYMETFLDQMDLWDATLVMHGWGSVIGFDYAMRHPERIAGLVFYEGHVRPTLDWGMTSLPMQQLLSMVNSGEIRQDAVLTSNAFIELFLPMARLGRLPQETLEAYQRAFDSPASRRLLWQYIQELPLPGRSDDVVTLIEEYSTWLQQTDIPKLLIYSVPGFMTTMDLVNWCELHLPFLEVLEIGEAMHFAQETKSQAFGSGVLTWYKENISQLAEVV